MYPFNISILFPYFVTLLIIISPTLILSAHLLSQLWYLHPKSPQRNINNQSTETEFMTFIHDFAHE